VYTFALLLWLVPVIFMAGPLTVFHKIGVIDKTTVIIKLLVLLIPGLGIVKMYTFLRQRINISYR